jgi:hypothetical protein
MKAIFKKIRAVEDNYRCPVGGSMVIDFAILESNPNYRFIRFFKSKQEEIIEIEVKKLKEFNYEVREIQFLAPTIENVARLEQPDVVGSLLEKSEKQVLKQRNKNQNKII